MKYYYQFFLILVLLSSCGSDNSLSPEELITNFKQQARSINSENNLVKEIKLEYGDLSLIFEDSTTVSINSDLVSYELLDWNVKLNFFDNSLIELMSIGTNFQINQINDDSTNVPLSKEIEIQIPYAGLVSWTTLGRNGISSNISSKDILVTKGNFKTFIHGLYIDGQTEVNIEYKNIYGYTRFIRTINVNPSDFSISENQISIHIESMGDENIQRLFLFANRAGKGPTIIDHFGDIRYYLDENAAGGYGLKQTSKGTLLWAIDDTIMEVKLNGEILWNHQIPEKYGSGSGIHHDIVDIGEDQFFLSVSNNELSTIEDIIILYDARSSSVLKEWNLNESVPKTDYFIGSDGRAQTFNDWFHVNAIDYVEGDNSILISGQRSGVVKVSWDNKLEWFLTDYKRFEDKPIDITNKILYNQHNEVITWGQHNIRYDSLNDIYYLFDNGLGRDYSNVNKYSRGVKFSINQDDLSYEIINTYGENFIDYHSPIISGIDFNQTGSVLTLFGSIGYQLDYVNNKDWVGQVWKNPQPDYGAALIEYNDKNELIFNAQISLKRGNGLDPGIYRAVYVDLTP